MKKAGNIFLLAFFSLGTFFLPVGNFALLKDLPAMFEHCKATEDSDLNVFEFLFEHVSVIGQLVEGIEHELEDEDDGDKPHAPIQFHLEQQQIICVHHTIKVPVIKPLQIFVLSPNADCSVYVSEYISTIFRPPIFA